MFARYGFEAAAICSVWQALTHIVGCDVEAFELLLDTGPTGFLILREEVKEGCLEGGAIYCYRFLTVDVIIAVLRL